MSLNGNRAPITRSLSARLLGLTVVFLLVGEILIFVPSIARFRATYLEERIAAAHLATIGLDSSGAGLSPEIEDALLTHAGVLSVTIRRDAPKLALGREAPVAATFELGRENLMGQVLAAIDTWRHRGQRVIRVVAPSPMAWGTTIDVTLIETPLYIAMRDYAGRIAAVSLFLSAIVGVLLFVALRRLIVRPLEAITGRLAAFRRTPEDQSQDGVPSRRGDELGIVDRELGAMIGDLRQALAQKARLAALGEAVSKLNHDLRNILGTALLVSDRLEHSADPAVRAVTPRLIQTLERAIRLCQATLDFARSQPRPPSFVAVALAPLIEEVVQALPLAGKPCEITIEIDPGLIVRGDADQLHRLFLNLAKNAFQAISPGGEIRFRGRAALEESVVVEIGDDGPGLPRPVRQRLFEPFAATGETGGSGLGLAISREIARAHGGELSLLATGPSGTTFSLTLPAARRLAA